MSTLKVDGIRSNSATSDAITLADNGTCTANITNNLSNRNLIINGAMQVAQRGTSYSGNNYNTVDRIRPMNGGGAVTQAQVDISSSDTPYTLGFRKALKVTNSTAASDVNDYRDIRYNVEAQDIANSGFNLGSASSKITFSFWAKSSVAMTYYYFIYVPDSGKHYVASFALSANTWTKVTKIIPGASGLSVDNDNGNGFNIQIAMHWGSDYTTSGQALDTWGTWSGSSRVPDMASTWASTTNATFEITGVQLEVGSVATDFEHRSFAQELALCQRYFYRHVTGHPQLINDGFYYLSSYMMTYIDFPVQMRAIPTLSATSGTDYWTLLRNAGTDHFNSFSLHSYTGTRVSCLYNNSEISGSVGHSGMVRTNNAACRIDFIAEL